MPLVVQSPILGVRKVSYDGKDTYYLQTGEALPDGSFGQMEVRLEGQPNLTELQRDHIATVAVTAYAGKRGVGFSQVPNTRIEVKPPHSAAAKG
ncbi:MAG: hypothetical protein RIC14_07845 [Filomicrobium sp.]